MALLCVLLLSGPVIGMQEGQVHPDPILPRVEGGGFARLSDYRGRKLVVFHFASW